MRLLVRILRSCFMFTYSFLSFPSTPKSFERSLDKYFGDFQITIFILSPVDQFIRRYISVLPSPPDQNVSQEIIAQARIETCFFNAFGAPFSYLISTLLNRLMSNHKERAEESLGRARRSHTKNALLIAVYAHGSAFVILFLSFSVSREIDQKHADIRRIYTAYPRRLTDIHRSYLIKLFRRLKS